MNAISTLLAGADIRRPALRDRAGDLAKGSDAKVCDLHGRKSKILEPRQTVDASPHDVTALLIDWSRGNRAALDHLLPFVYAELRRIAARQLGAERVDHTLQPTALIHEVYLRIVDQHKVDWQNRAHFFGVAAQVMRRILVDHARRRKAGKRGEGVPCVSIDDARDVPAPTEIPILALDQVLDRLQNIDPDLARIVELRAFGGLTVEEAAHVLDVSPSTAKRDWRTAKAWITRELGGPRSHI